MPSTFHPISHDDTTSPLQRYTLSKDDHWMIRLWQKPAKIYLQPVLIHSMSINGN